MKTEQWVLEWSKANNGFHIQPLSTSLAYAQKCFMDDRANNWCVLMIGDRDAVSKMADTHRNKLEGRVKRETLQQQMARAI